MNVFTCSRSLSDSSSFLLIRNINKVSTGLSIDSAACFNKFNALKCLEIVSPNYVNKIKNWNTYVCLLRWNYDITLQTCWYAASSRPAKSFG